MPKSPDSVLSAIDVNGDELDPVVLRQTHEAMLARNGYVVLRNVPDTFDHTGFVSSFGDLIPAPSGALIGDVVAEPGMDDTYYGGNSRALLPHTEGYEFRGLPPRYLALWCVRPAAPGAGGETTLLDSRPLLDESDEELLAKLRTIECDWVASEGLRRRGVELTARHPFLEEAGASQVLRFSANNVAYPADELRIAGFCEMACAKFEALGVAVNYAKNDLLQWDNWRMLHSRNAFDDMARHLKRAQIVC
jgi:alpha-ketoglutarate-dependent taurine dioxygenase